MRDLLVKLGVLLLRRDLPVYRGDSDVVLATYPHLRSSRAYHLPCMKLLPNITPVSMILVKLDHPAQGACG